MKMVSEPILFHRPLLSLGLAVGLHLAILIMALLAPHLWNYRPKLPEIHTVNLFNVQEIATPAAPAAPAAPAPAPAPVAAPVAAPTPPPAAKLPAATVPEPPTAKPVVAPQETKKVVEPAPAPIPPPAPAISTRPIQVKTKSDLDKLRRLQDSLKAGEQAKAAAKEAEAAAREAAREKELAAREAVAALRQMYQTQGAPRTGGSAGTSAATGAAAGAAGGPVTVDAATREYLIAVNNRIQAHWSLPDLPSWNKELLAIIIVTVRRDGSVAKSAFEQRADNLYFNQLVQKTIQDASPLPPFPPDLRQPEMEIGLRFRPGEVF